MRTTKNQLQPAVDRLNRLTKSPLTPWGQISGKNIANVGNYHLDEAYGGFKLLRTMNQDGGTSDVFRAGHVSKTKLLDLIHAYIAGIESTS